MCGGEVSCALLWSSGQRGERDRGEEDSAAQHGDPPPVIVTPE
jgi:hypothetical protein